MRKWFIVGGGTYWSEIGRCSLTSMTGMTTGMTSSIRTSTGSSYYPASSNTSSVVRSTSTGMTTGMTTASTSLGRSSCDGNTLYRLESTIYYTGNRSYIDSYWAPVGLCSSAGMRRSTAGMITTTASGSSVPTSLTGKTTGMSTVPLTTRSPDRYNVACGAEIEGYGRTFDTIHKACNYAAHSGKICRIKDSNHSASVAVYPVRGKSKSALYAECVKNVVANLL